MESRQLLPSPLLSFFFFFFCFFFFFFFLSCLTPFFFPLQTSPSERFFLFCPNVLVLSFGHSYFPIPSRSVSLPAGINNIYGATYFFLLSGIFVPFLPSSFFLSLLILPSSRLSLLCRFTLIRSYVQNNCPRCLQSSPLVQSPSLQQRRIPGVNGSPRGRRK